LSGLVTAVYGRRALEGATLDALDQVLAASTGSLQRTRRGRVWDCTVNGRPIHVAVEETANVLRDCEEELLSLGLLPGDVPLRVLITTPCRAPEDRTALDSLIPQIVTIVNGVSVGPER
jgi:hypothetical protein